MQSRYRNTGDGFRPNSGDGFRPNSGDGYRPNYRNPNPNRGRYGGGRRSHPPPPQAAPPPRGDVLMEAGRLAAEYFVHKGLLSPDILHRRNQEFKHVSGDSRASVLNQGTDGEVRGRPGYDDDYNFNRNQRGGRKRNGGYNRDYNNEWGGRDDGRRGQWVDRGRGYRTDFDGGEGGDGDFAAPYQRRRGGFEEVGSSARDDRYSKSEATGESGTVVDARELVDTGSMVSSTSIRKDQLGDGDVVEDGTKVVDEVKTEDSKKNKDVEEGSMDVDGPVNKPESISQPLSFEGVATEPPSYAVHISPSADQDIIAEADNRMVVTVAGVTEVIEGGEVVEESHKDKIETVKCQESIVSSVLPEDPMEVAEELERESDKCPPGFGAPEMPEECPPGFGAPEVAEEVPPGFGAPELPEFASPGSGAPEMAKVVPSGFGVTEIVDDAPPGFGAPELPEDSGSFESHEVSEEAPRGFGAPELPEEAPPGFGATEMQLNLTKEQGVVQHCKEMEGIERGDTPPSRVTQEVLEANQWSPCGEKVSVDEHMLEGVDQEKPVSEDATLVPKHEPEIDIRIEEEKQLLTSSFDLNLMGTPEVTEVHPITRVHDVIEVDEVTEVHEVTEMPEITEIPDDPVDNFQASDNIVENGNELPLDANLSMGNNTDATDDYSLMTVAGKEIQVIDLEDDSPMDDGVRDQSKLENEAMYSNMDNFPSHTVQEDLDSIHDGYSLAFSEFIGNDISDCSPVPAHLNNLDPEIGLHDGQGVPGDDESIYVSLDEIPIGFMGLWDQPPQEYGKFF